MKKISKIHSAINGVSCQRCFSCGATPSLMNDIDAILERPVDESSLENGIPITHAGIRLLENVCNISKRLICKKWQVS